MKDVSVMFDDIKFNYRVGLIIEKNNQIIIESSRVVDFSLIPGGRVKTLESTSQAMKREIKEEMGIDIEESEIVGKGLIQSFFKLDNKRYHELFFIYKLTLSNDDTRFDNVSDNLDSETNYYQWINKNTLEENNVLPNALKDIIDSNEFKTIIINEL
jgi:8-oxo-dGTP pyrophosphatase MutT (NUDIX family)